jgi:mannose-6-phosphate isomerase-like protein (cupin superfamily)
MKRSFAVVALLAAWIAPARAQQPADQVTYVDAAKVAEAFAKGGALATGSDHIASVLRRVKPGQVEVHTKETDIFYIVDGTATFVTGGTVVGQKELRANQMTGTDIQSGQTHQLKKGDFITIPAGIPHWFKDVPSSGITYYMVKAVKP